MSTTTTMGSIPLIVRSRRWRKPPTKLGCPSSARAGNAGGAMSETLRSRDADLAP